MPFRTDSFIIIYMESLHSGFANIIEGEEIATTSSRSPQIVNFRQLINVHEGRDTILYITFYFLGIPVYSTLWPLFVRLIFSY